MFASQHLNLKSATVDTLLMIQKHPVTWFLIAAVCYTSSFTQLILNNYFEMYEILKWNYEFNISRA